MHFKPVKMTIGNFLPFVHDSKDLIGILKLADFGTLFFPIYGTLGYNYFNFF